MSPKKAKTAKRSAPRARRDGTAKGTGGPRAAPRRSDSKSASATYVYCVVRAAKAPEVGGVEPLPGMGAPRALSAGDGVFVIVSDAPSDAYGEDALNEKLKDMEWVSRCALAHEAVIEAARGARALVPMKLFTIFNHDARALALVHQDRRRLEAVLDHVEGCAEFGVRLSLDERRARQSAADRATKSAGGSGGAAFLLRKKNLKDAAEEVSRSARDVANDVFESLSGRARDSVRRTEVEGLVTGSRLLMDGVFLVPNTDAAKFRAAIEETSRTLSDRGYDLVLNGPWPAYHFVGRAA